MMVAGGLNLYGIFRANGTGGGIFWRLHRFLKILQCFQNLIMDNSIIFNGNYIPVGA
jgi:hypothetical protein